MVIKFFNQQQTSNRLVMWGGQASFWNLVSGQPASYDDDDIVK